MVIIGLMLLWFLMDILVRLTNIRHKEKKADEVSIPDLEQDLDLECKHKSAAASIAVAMALLNTSLLTPGQTDNQQMSAWQINHRNQQMLNRLETTFRDRENK